MKIRIFVREPRGPYTGGVFSDVEFEAMPRAGDHVAHKTERAWLRVDLVAQGVAGAGHEIYVTKVDQLKTVSAVEQSDRAAPMSPDDLFSQLIESKELISYKGAFAQLIGTPPNPWRQIPCANDVAGLAAQSRSVQVEGISISLDALVVNHDTRLPTKRHFAGKSYTLDQWQKAFGRWTISSRGKS